MSTAVTKASSTASTPAVHCSPHWLDQNLCSGGAGRWWGGAGRSPSGAGHGLSGTGRDGAAPLTTRRVGGSGRGLTGALAGMCAGRVSAFMAVIPFWRVGLATDAAKAAADA
jgi:hypothetical protein